VPTTVSPPLSGLDAHTTNIFARKSVSVWSRLSTAARARLGIRRSFRVGGVYYKETSTAPLWHALSPQGGGVKEFRVTYADGSKQYIHCTPDRVYADLMGAILLPEFQRVASMIRPGQRVVCLPGGTGYAPAWLGAQVGASGAVVSIEADKESALYAQKRYAGDNIAHETGNAASLKGETDGSFDAAISMTHVPQENEDRLFRELWRVTKPGGWMLVGRPLIAWPELRRTLNEAMQPERGKPLVAEPDTGSGGSLELISGSNEIMRIALARKAV